MHDQNVGLSLLCSTPPHLLGLEGALCDVVFSATLLLSDPSLAMQLPNCFPTNSEAGESTERLWVSPEGPIRPLCPLSRAWQSPRGSQGTGWGLKGPAVWAWLCLSFPWSTRLAASRAYLGCGRAELLLVGFVGCRGGGALLPGSGDLWGT